MADTGRKGAGAGYPGSETSAACWIVAVLTIGWGDMVWLFGSPDPIVSVAIDSVPFALALALVLVLQPALP